MFDSLQKISNLEKQIDRWLPRSSPSTDERPLADLSLAEFIPAVSPKYDVPPHLALLCELIERSKRERVRAVVSMPPRHGKTETELHAIAHMLLAEPWRQVCFGGFAARFAEKKSRKARGLAQRAGVPLANDSKSRQDWRTGVDDGGLWATSVLGPITGEGFHNVFIDDPIKGRKVAESALFRDQIWEWIDEDVLSRVEPNGSVILTQTRWHPDDPAGRALEEGWESLHLPAICDGPGDPLDRSEGEALWPARWPVESFAEHQKNEYKWHSIYQGRPRRRGGKVFRDAYFYDGAVPNGYRCALGIDCAYTAKTSADWSVSFGLAEVGGVYYVSATDYIRDQCEIESFSPRLAAIQAKPEYAEALTRWLGSSIEEQVAKLLRKLGCKISFKHASTDKLVRATDLAVAWNSGRVLLPRTAPWVPAFIKRMHEFTGTGNEVDDEIDALAAAHGALQVARYD